MRQTFFKQRIGKFLSRSEKILSEQSMHVLGALNLKSLNLFEFWKPANLRYLFFFYKVSSV